MSRPINLEEMQELWRLRDLALCYTSFGFRVFPCVARDKRPMTKNGFKDATDDYRQIRAWWKETPEANIGIATGSVSGIFVLDLDTAEALAWYGAKSLDDPDTYTVETGNGRHYYFWLPEDEGVAIPCYTNFFRNDPDGPPGVDVKSHGGYVIAAGSTHETGSQYSDGDIDPDQLVVRDPPPWLVELLAQKPAEPKIVEKGAPIVPVINAGPWAQAAFRGEIDRVQKANPGERNDTLNRASYSLGQIVGGGHLDRDSATTALLNAADRTGLVDDDGERAVIATIESGINAGFSEPRHPDQPDLQAKPASPALGDLDLSIPARRQRFDFMADITTPTKWLIPRYWAAGIRFVVTGDPGTGKMTWLRYIASCCAAGINPFQPEEAMAPLRVYMLDLQESESQLSRNFSNTVLGDFPDDQIETMRQYLKVDFMPGGMDLLDMTQRTDLQADLDEFKPQMIVLGPAYRAYSASEANHNRQIQQLNRIMDFWRERYECGILVEAHHNSRNPQGSKAPSNAQAWERWCDEGMCLVDYLRDVPSDQKHGERIVKLEPWRGSRDNHKPLPEYWTSEGALVFSPMTSDEAQQRKATLDGSAGPRLLSLMRGEPREAEDFILDYLADQPDRKAFVTDIKDAARNAGFSTRAVDTARKNLVPDRCKRIRLPSRGKYLMQIQPHVHIDR
jgi:Bifunctional DNA primase/polymerase, N-terminal/AAA domain